MVIFFRGKDKQRGESPDAQEKTGRDPDFFIAAALGGDQPAQDGVEKMHESGRAQQGRRVEIRFDEVEPGEITQDGVKAQQPLTLPSGP